MAGASCASLASPRPGPGVDVGCCSGRKPSPARAAGPRTPISSPNSDRPRAKRSGAVGRARSPLTTSSATDADREQDRFMATPPRFHRLKVSDVRRETPDAVSVAFEVPPDLASAYAFVPGQYLTLRAIIDGEDLRRSYSICSGPDDHELRIAVKRVEGGPFSAWINLHLKAGDRLDVMTPTGRFGVRHQPGAAGTYLGIA